MPQSLILNNEKIRKQTHAYLAGICKNLQLNGLRGKIENCSLFTGKKDMELFLSVHLMLKVSENTSPPRQNIIAMNRFRMNIAGYAKNMTLILMSAMFGNERREDCKTLSGFYYITNIFVAR